MLRILFRHRSGTIIPDFPEEQLATAMREPGSRIWIDMEKPSEAEYTRILQGVFKFHPLAIENAVNDSLLPKVDDYTTYLYLVFHTFRMGDETMDIDTHEIDVFLGSNYLITIHDGGSRTIKEIWPEQNHRERGLARGPAMLLYELLDRQLEGYMPLIDRFDQQVEQLGDEIFMRKGRDEKLVMNDILTAKTTALRLRRILVPQREMVSRLAFGDFAVIPAESRIYFQDVYDHLHRLSDLADSTRELVNSTAAVHLAITSNRLNEIMKVLTVISTIFMPLSFVAGVYGMNFLYMPELEWRWAYPLVWVIFLSIAATMLTYFRRRGWL
jgi:magnesium transporter